MEDVKAGISEPTGAYIAQHNGFQQGFPADFDKQYALDLCLFWQFLENTQAKELAKLKVHHANDWQRKVLTRFDRLMLLRRKDELELYKLFANDAAFKTSWMQSVQSVQSVQRMGGV